MHDFKKLRVWHESLQFAVEILRLTETGPLKTRRRLREQMDDAAESIPTNIAEGCGRHGLKEHIQALQISMGSARESESHLHTAYGAGLITKNDFVRLTRRTNRIQRLLAGLIRFKRGKLRELEKKKRGAAVTPPRSIPPSPNPPSP